MKHWEAHPKLVKVISDSDIVQNLFPSQRGSFVAFIFMEALRFLFFVKKHVFEAKFLFPSLLVLEKALKG